MFAFYNVNEDFSVLVPFYGLNKHLTKLAVKFVPDLLLMNRVPSFLVGLSWCFIFCGSQIGSPGI